MSNEENRQMPEGYYPNYNPGAAATPGANIAQGQGVPGYQAPSGYGSPYYPQMPTAPQMPMAQPYPTQNPMSNVPGMLPVEESYIENILRLNKGKIATVYMTFENNERWNAKVFKGVIEAAGRDHIILSDPESGRRYVLLMVYLDYITFDEELNYEYPYGAPGLAAYPPR
ncbi:spore coat protein GerQ [Aquibacillus koreensis]|uniref:Spore coat protein GerQ n=1 Tax=Aquibacillus koreensis TaxID=279446 RepID=A0A9X3WJA2_9BACI|nr:spore coat protein GerQ [Aquibacillus koreensis]MCT2538260.1 spore coat protein GerQ [Aquibacillus koreensis]MDC3420797.1 spore coat protein GerQ [Aquibacillus koreensis]